MSKSHILRAAALAAVAFSMSGAHAATDTATMTVSASVAAICKVSLSSAMAFGPLDVTVTTDATKVVTASYQCTKGTAVTSFTVGGLTTGTYTNTMTSGTTADTIPFSIGWTNPAAFTGAGMSSTAAKTTVTLTGTIVNADYVNVTPASYTRDVSIAVNY